MRKNSITNYLVLPIIGCLCFSLLLPMAVRAQQPAAPTTHVTDSANALDGAVKQEIENVLTNLQARSGINFTIVLIKSTGGRDIYDYSYELAKAWDIGLRTSSNKSLLMVIATDDKLSFTQLSKGVAKSLPDGAVADLSQRLRPKLNAGRASEGLDASVKQFVSDLSAKLGFSTDGMNQPGAFASAPETTGTPATTPAPTEVVAVRADVPSTAPTTTQPVRENPKPSKTPAVKKPAQPVDDEAEAEEVALMQTHPFAVRVEELKTFIDTHPDSKSKARAIELLVSSRAALGDEKLRTGDTAGGVQQLMLAISDAPMDASDKLFNGVIAQIPLNLYMRNEAAEGFKAAQAIESKYGNDAKRLLAISGFYLSLERGDEAARVAEQATRLAPDMAAAYNALGLALQISLRLDEATAAYKRALELDSKSPGARRSLADLTRANGNSADALALYREQLTIDPTDRNARAGMVLALYDLNQTAEADREFEAVLKENPRNVTLLAGVAYWSLAHNDYRRGLDLAKKSADIEPRYTWGQIALARALIADKRPEVAEACLRFARQHGRFATLEYELANSLSALGLYEEAGDILTQSFRANDDVIETTLAGHVPAHASSFIELLAPERKASLFQFAAADTDDNARRLKGLLMLMSATSSPDGTKIDEDRAVSAAREFASGTDNMRVYRQLFAANRLLKRGVGIKVAQELADAARDGVNTAVAVPAATIAVQADELRELRAQAIAAGGTPEVPDAPPNALANILRGRIEDLSGWSLFNQDKNDQAIEHLKLAAGIIPEATPSWRTAVWHLGTALEQAGKNNEALSYYIKSYNAGPNDSVHRSIIENLYRKVNGSIQGLDERIGPAQAISTTATPSRSGTASPVDSPAADTAIATPVPTPVATPRPEPAQPTEPPQPASTPAPTPEAEPASSPSPSPSSEVPATRSRSELPAPKQSPSPSSSPATKPASDTRPRRVKPPSD